MATRTYYHYTDKQGAEGIGKSKKIAESLEGATPGVDDAVFGKAVYLTTLSPETSSKKQIIENNYDRAGAKGLVKELEHKVAYVVAVDLPIGEVQTVATKDKRDIVKYIGELDLTKYKYKIYSTKFGLKD